MWACCNSTSGSVKEKIVSCWHSIDSQTIIRSYYSRDQRNSKSQTKPRYTVCLHSCCDLWSYHTLYRCFSGSLTNVSPHSAAFKICVICPANPHRQYCRQSLFSYLWTGNKEVDNNSCRCAKQETRHHFPWFSSMNNLFTYTELWIDLVLIHIYILLL